MHDCSRNPASLESAEGRNRLFSRRRGVDLGGSSKAAAAALSRAAAAGLPAVRWIDLPAKASHGLRLFRRRTDSGLWEWSRD